MGEEGWIEAADEGDPLVLRAGGPWLIGAAAALDAKLRTLRLPDSRRVQIDLSKVEALDSVGAWLFVRLERSLAARGSEVTLDRLAPDLRPLFDQVARFSPTAPAPRRKRTPPGVAEGLAHVGRGTVEFLETGLQHLGFFGMVAVTGLRTLRHPGRVRLTSLVTQMERIGVSSLPIVGLLSFLVGIVTAYQGADQLRRFGAEIYTANLLGIGFLREMGALLAAIIVAGRSGSAFAAEIGAMEVHEEIDALRTLRLDPIEILVLPRLLALLLSLPLLTFYADALGVLGGALLSWAVLGIPLPVFLEQLRGAVSGTTLWLGLVKAPFFAGAIALIGCNEGFSVIRSAESVGRHTTRAVVQSIFMVIVLDAIFSILFSWLGL